MLASLNANQVPISGNVPFRAMIGTGQQATHPFVCNKRATSSGGGRDSSRLAPIITGPLAVGLDAYEDETHAAASLEEVGTPSFVVGRAVSCQSRLTKDRSLYMMAKPGPNLLEPRYALIEDRLMTKRRSRSVVGALPDRLCQGVGAGQLVPFLVTERHFSYTGGGEFGLRHQCDFLGGSSPFLGSFAIAWTLDWLLRQALLLAGLALALGSQSPVLLWF